MIGIRADRCKNGYTDHEPVLGSLNHVRHDQACQAKQFNYNREKTRLVISTLYYVSNEE